MDLISREVAIEALGEEPLRWNDTITEGKGWNDWKYYVNAIKSVPTVPAVPLDKLCEWLTHKKVTIPCKLCEYYGAGDCTVVNDVTKLCPNWRKVITKWMEEQDAID